MREQKSLIINRENSNIDFDNMLSLNIDNIPIIGEALNEMHQKVENLIENGHPFLFTFDHLPRSIARSTSESLKSDLKEKGCVLEYGSGGLLELCYKDYKLVLFLNNVSTSDDGTTFDTIDAHIKSSSGEKISIQRKNNQNEYGNTEMNGGRILITPDELFAILERL